MPSIDDYLKRTRESNLTTNEIKEAIFSMKKGIDERRWSSG